MQARIAAAILAAAALPLGPALAQDAPEMEILADLPVGPGNLTVTEDGAVVISAHPSYESDSIGVIVSPDGAVAPFPPAETGADMQRVLSVRADGNGQVWMLSGMPGPGGKAFYIVDAKTGALVRTIEVEAPGSFLNDMALALGKGAVIISNPGAGASLDVLDVESGTLRRVLIGHPSVSPEDIDAPIDGIPLAQGRDENGELVPMRSGVNPITIDADEEWVYYGAMTGATLWRVRVDDLLDETLSEDALAARVEPYGDKAPSAGITIDDAGNVYVADVGARGIGVTTPDGAYRVLVQDDALIDWPDGLTVGGDGYVYFAANGLYRGWASHAHMPPAGPPFKLVRFKALAPTTAGR